MGGQAVWGREALALVAVRRGRGGWMIAREIEYGAEGEGRVGTAAAGGCVWDWEACSGDAACKKTTQIDARRRRFVVD